VNVTDYNLSDSEIHSRLTKELAERRRREEKAQFQKDRQARKAREEAQYRATESMREQREREQEAAMKERKRKQKERDRVYGQYEEAEEACRKRRRRDRRGSTPILGSNYEYGSSDEDIEHTGTRYPGGGRGEGDGSGFVYEEFIGGSGFGSGSSGASARHRNTIQTRKEREEKERERYISRWKSLLSTDESTAIDGIIETELSYLDIPWPIYSNVDLEKGQIARFLSNIALIQGRGESGSGKGGKEQDKEKERRVLREAIRNFHPDRFNSKVLPRVREGEREKVKEGMEICSRVLTDLIAQNASSR